MLPWIQPWISPGLLVLAGWQLQGSRVPISSPATRGGSKSLKPKLLVPCGKLGKAVLLPSLQPLVVQGGSHKQGPDEDPDKPRLSDYSSEIII